MQPFKQIPYQNYIQLRFNQKNLNQLSHQQALLKYKRNAQVLAEIFQLERKPLPDFPSDDNIPQQKLQEFQDQIEQGEKETQERVGKIEKETAKFEEFLERTKCLETQEQLRSFVEELKANQMYDQCHPFFIEDSPFYLNSVDEDCLEVKELRNVREQQQTVPTDFIDIN